MQQFLGFIFWQNARRQQKTTMSWEPFPGRVGADTNTTPMLMEPWSGRVRADTNNIMVDKEPFSGRVRAHHNESNNFQGAIFWHSACWHQGHKIAGIFWEPFPSRMHVDTISATKFSDTFVWESARGYSTSTQFSGSHFLAECAMTPRIQQYLGATFLTKIAKRDWRLRRTWKDLPSNEFVVLELTKAARWPRGRMSQMRAKSRGGLIELDAWLTRRPSGPGDCDLENPASAVVPIPGWGWLGFAVVVIFLDFCGSRF